MIDLYTWTTPNGRKVSIALEEMGLAYRAHAIDITKDEQFAPDFLKVSPNNKIPAIVDRDNGLSLFESGAILIYLAQKSGRFLPEGDGYWKALEWLMWQMGGFGPMLGQNHHFNLYAPEDLPYAKKRYTDETHRLYGVLNKRLEGREFVADDYSIADMAIVGWATLWERQKMDIAEFPNVKRWLDTMLARPAVEKGLAVAREARSNIASDNNAQNVLFGQRAR